MFNCAITTLKKHSSGDKFSPVEVGAVWQLQNAAADVLTGYRGKVFEFASEVNAQTWLCTNLARLKNAKQETPQSLIVKLLVIHAETNYAPLLVEIEAINQLNAGLWMPILCTDCDCSNEPIDGGNAASVYTDFINP